MYTTELTQTKMKKTLIVLGILMGSILFTGCEKKPAQESIAPAGQSAKMQVWTSQESTAIEALAREFVSAVKIKGLVIDVISFESDEILQQTLLQEMAKGAGPDVIFTDGEWIALNTEKLVPLKQEVGFGMNEFGSWFVRTATELLIQGNDIYGIPLSVDTPVVVFNEEYLIDRLLDRNTPGRTWKEFQEDVEALTQQDNSLTRFARAGVAMGRTDNVHHGADLLENILLQRGTPFFTEDGTAATFASAQGVNNEGRREKFGVEGLKFFTSFANKDYKNFSWNEYLASAEDKNKEYTAFVKGDVAMAFVYSKDFATIQALLESEKGAISDKNVYLEAFPQILNPENATSRIVIGRLFAGAVPRTTKFSNVAWRFLRYLSNERIQSGFHDATGLPTAHLNLIVEQAADPKTGVFARQAKFARANQLPVEKSFFHQKLDTLIQKVNDGGNPEQLLKTLETEMTDMREAEIKLEKKIKRDT